MSKLRNWQLKVGNFVKFHDDIVKVINISFHDSDNILVEELKAQESDHEDKMSFYSQLEFIHPVPASYINFKECGIFFPIVTNDFIITYNVPDHKLTIDHFSIKNKHTFTVEFIHDIQNFIIDFTKIKV